MKERRTTRRYDLLLPVAIRVPLEMEAVFSTGKTRDISTRGVYFTIHNDLRAGTELDLRMTLPAQVTGGPEVFIKATGKIVRVDRSSWSGDQPVGVAATFSQYEIVRNESVPR